MAKSIEQSRAIVQSMITLASAALGLVCALAWNDAIKTAMKAVLGEDDSLAGMFTYAILATIVAVVVLLILAKTAPKIAVKQRLLAKRKVDDPAFGVRSFNLAFSRGQATLPNCTVLS